MKKLYFFSLFLTGLIAAITCRTAAQTEAELIADGFQFTEGPVWVDGIGLLFSDIPANTVYKWHPDSGDAVAYLNPSGNSNGLALDKDGKLLLAQHGNRRVARLEDNGTQTALADSFNGKKLNSPNDIFVKSDGSIFFTDPPYGINQNQSELGFNGVYKIHTDGKVYLLDNSLHRPNGVVLSPDETKLYVTDTEVKRIYVWDVVNDTSISNKKTFATVTGGTNGLDGMKIDDEGNLYVTGPFGVWVYSPDGEVLDTIRVPGQVTNCGWGEDKSVLYITTNLGGNQRGSVYRYELNLTDINDESQGSLTPDFYKLYNNYPNPFNPTTTIKFSIPEKETGYASSQQWVNLIVYDMLGKEVATLVNEMKPSGEYEVEFNGDNLPSGFYFASLEAGDYKETVKMVLLK